MRVPGFVPLALCIVASAQDPVAAPVIDVGNTKYQGFVDSSSNISVYLGIRYAAAPLGELRWRAPQSPPRFPETQSAAIQPAECPQASTGMSPTNPIPALSRRDGDITFSEDCLFLNVYFPGTSIPKRKLPVVVWIHGGGYIALGAAVYDGRDLINGAGKEVVAVVIQYRLGVFGFLSGAKIKADGALNAGLLDQEFALKWVQNHIGEFGGDRDQVTIWGESAGAGSVLQHVIARDGKVHPPLFRAAITSSSFLPPQYLFNDPYPESVFNQVAAQSGCANSTDTLSCLRATDASILQAANLAVNRAAFFGTFATVPVIDGEFITQRPTQALRQKKTNGRVFLAVTNRHEGDLFVNPNAITSSAMDAAQYASLLYPRIGSAQAALAGRLYAGVGSPVEQANAIMGECPCVHLPLVLFIECIPWSVVQGEIIVILDITGAGIPYAQAEYAVPPALHGDDIAYYFPTSIGAPPRTFNNTAFATSFAQSFFDVVRFMDPNRKFDKNNTTPLWNKFSLRDTEMLFNRTDSGQPDIRPIRTDVKLLQRCAPTPDVTKSLSSGRLRCHVAGASPYYLTSTTITDNNSRFAEISSFSNEMTSALLGKAGKKLFEKHLEQYAPADPKYEFYVDERGEQKRRKRELPPGLSVRDAKILKAVKNRASRLDRGFNLCGFRFGYTFFIGLVPVVGDVTNIGLNYFLVVRKAKQADLPDWLVRRMLFNNALSGAISFIPFVGDVMLAIVKANSRNAALLEEFLRVRGEEFIAIRAAGGDPDKMQKDAAKAARKKRGKNKKGKEAAAPPGRPEEIAPGVTKGDAAQVKPGSGRVEGEKIGTNGY
ncbi:hypothetical protein EYR40_007464 [Pleurotus pulmonarius]|nr:hypothetical protein EYR40_007464 [Pleurotus pulmonarius]